MTPPTPAQIEAAAKVLLDHFNRGGRLTPYIAIAKATLAAAAEVDSYDIDTVHGEKFQDNGEQAPCNDVEWEKAKRELNNRTIERCAQVALRARFPSEEAVEIAAAIRALKDKP